MSANELPPEIAEDEDYDDDGELDVEWFPVPNGLRDDEEE